MMPVRGTWTLNSGNGEVTPLPRLSPTRTLLARGWKKNLLSQMTFQFQFIFCV